MLVGSRQNSKSIVRRTPLERSIVKSVRFRLNWLNFHYDKVGIDARVPHSKFEASLSCDHIFRRAYLSYYRNCVVCRILAGQRQIFSLLEDKLCEVFSVFWTNRGNQISLRWIHNIGVISNLTPVWISNKGSFYTIGEGLLCDSVFLIDERDC